MATEAFKIWRNPSNAEEVCIYMGEFCPPNGQISFLWVDLCNLGFPSGAYTIKVPDSLQKLYILPPWQQVTVP